MTLLSGSTYEGNGDSTSVQSGGDTGSSYLSMTSGDSLFSGSYAPFSKGTYQCGGKKKRKGNTRKKRQRGGHLDIIRAKMLEDDFPIIGGKKKRKGKSTTRNLKKNTNKRRTSKKGKKRQRGGYFRSNPGSVADGAHIIV